MLTFRLQYLADLLALLQLRVFMQLHHDNRSIAGPFLGCPELFEFVLLAFGGLCGSGGLLLLPEALELFVSLLGSHQQRLLLLPGLAGGGLVALPRLNNSLQPRYMSPLGGELPHLHHAAGPLPPRLFERLLQGLARRVTGGLALLQFTTGCRHPLRLLVTLALPQPDHRRPIRGHALIPNYLDLR